MYMKHNTKKDKKQKKKNKKRTKNISQSHEHDACIVHSR